MPVRRGAQMLQRLQEQPHEIWRQGERVTDVTMHPAFSHGVHSLAALYDWGGVPGASRAAFWGERARLLHLSARARR